jgi:hypothetical protein
MKVKEVIAQKDFTLLLTFSNNEQRKFDVKPYLNKGDFMELKDLKLFLSVRPFMGSIQWENELDISPETLYDESVLIKTGIGKMEV